MRILSEGYRRVNAKGEGIDYEAKQNSSVKFGTLIVGACIGSFSMFTTIPANGQVEGKEFIAEYSVATTPQESFEQFKNWACDILVDQTLCDKYKNAKGWEDLNIEDIIEWKKANSIEDTVANLALNASAICDVEFNRTASPTITIIFNSGSVNWEALVFWENMDAYWGASESSSTPYLAKVHEGDADASIVMYGSIGTADYESTVFWQYMDVDWETEDTTSQNQFLSKVYERTISTGMTISASVGLAGWASDFIWEGLDINWDNQVAGVIHQGNISPVFSLSTNLNSELILGWNSETTSMENLTRNWEAT